MNTSFMAQVFATNENNGCFNYEECRPPYAVACPKAHPGYRYNDASAAWVLISAIIVFFMKAGFLLIEIAFAQNVRDKRHVVVVKHLDVFASAFAFFLLGFDTISNYDSLYVEDNTIAFKISDPILWFFKFTFASNAATILGGCLVTNKYKLRVISALLSAFMISGIIHPLIARLIWGNKPTAYLSAYRFRADKISYDVCDKELPFHQRLYVLDFAGGGAVHLVGGAAGLVLCLFAKLHKILKKKKEEIRQNENTPDIQREQSETLSDSNFWDWMYPVDGGGETTSEAALGVLILWFCWFAFNCGSTENLESIRDSNSHESYHSVPSIIAINMILAAASGGLLSVIIASWAQIRTRSDSMNANEIANGILSALVAITAGCPFVEFWAACVIGVIAVVVYHFGCWLEYRLGIADTARVVPVHGMCGLWSLIAVGLFVFGNDAKCKLHSTFEGLCYCTLRLPYLSYGERLAAQLLGAIFMIGVTVLISTCMYGLLFMIPLNSRTDPKTEFGRSYNKFTSKVFKILFSHEKVCFEGNWLFTGPGEIVHADIDSAEIQVLIADKQHNTVQSHGSNRSYGATIHETLGTTANVLESAHGSMYTGTN